MAVDQQNADTAPAAGQSLGGLGLSEDIQTAPSTDPGEAVRTVAVETRRNRSESKPGESDDVPNGELDASDDEKHMDDDPQGSQDGDEGLEAEDEGEDSAGEDGDDSPGEDEPGDQEFRPESKSRKKWAATARSLAAKLDKAKERAERAEKQTKTAQASVQRQLADIRRQLNTREAAKQQADTEEGFFLEGDEDEMPTRGEINARLRRQQQQQQKAAEPPPEPTAEEVSRASIRELVNMGGGEKFGNWINANVADDPDYQELQYTPARVLYAARAQHKAEVAKLKNEHAKAMKAQETKLMKRRTNLDRVPTNDRGTRGGAGTGSGGANRGGLQPETNIERAMMSLAAQVGGEPRIVGKARL